MHGPACVFGADLTPFSLQRLRPAEARRVVRGDARGGLGLRAALLPGNLLATSWVNPLVAHRSNFVCASQLAQKLTYLPPGQHRLHRRVGWQGLGRAHGHRAGEGGLALQCSAFTPIFIGMHRNAPLSPMEEGARVPHSYGSYAPSTYGSYGPRKANPSTAWPVGPEVGPASAYYSCAPIGMHGPACISRAELTPCAPRQLENTYIVWAGDHGDGQSDHYHWRKGFPYEFASHGELSGILIHHTAHHIKRAIRE
jgi:hypothetical protein